MPATHSITHNKQVACLAEAGDIADPAEALVFGLCAGGRCPDEGIWRPACRARLDIEARYETVGAQMREGGCA